MAIAQNDIRQVAYPRSADCGFNSAPLFGPYVRKVAPASSEVDIRVDIHDDIRVDNPAGTTPKQIFKYAYDLGEAIGSSLDACGSRKVRAKKQIETEIAPERLYEQRLRALQSA